MLNKEQFDALNCENSIWLSASAGTGKTTVLVNRVIKLAILGVSLNKILCITFTNAAASEMLERIVAKFESWSKFSNREISFEVEKILGRNPNEKEITRAKNIFLEYCNDTKSLKIQTIHSFCQYILRMFAIEASINPDFQVIDEIVISKVVQKIKLDLLDFSLKPQNIIDAVSFFIENLHDTRFDVLLNQIIVNRSGFDSVFEKFENHEKYYFHLRRKFKISKSYESALLLLLKEISFINVEAERKIDCEFVKKFNNYLLLSNKEKVNKFEDLQVLFLTLNNEKRKKIVSDDFTRNHPALSREIHELQNKIYELVEYKNSIYISEISKNLFCIAKYLIEKYQDYKKNLGYLDYDDLIFYAKNLLTKSELKDWVLYKLDGGIEHILLDEAQDTNSSQWQVIDAIIDDFYSREGLEKNKTLFVVGDDKQSIYSFQGAIVDNFYKYQNYIKEKIKNAGKKCDTINLTINYRSGKALVEAFNYFFNELKLDNNDLFCDFVAAKNIRNTPSKIELINLHKADKKDDFWPIIKEKDNESSGCKYAISIATYIKNKIQNGFIVPSTQKPASENDFMILIRKRDDFVDKLNDSLLKLNLATSGVDKILLKEQIAVLDLVSIAKFVMQPKDELNLASLLKSCFIGIDDKALHHLCIERAERKINLYEVIKLNYPKINQILDEFICVYEKSTLSNFFYNIVDELGYRENLNSISSESNDSVKQFLINSYNYSVNVENCINSFVTWFENSEIETKRDTSNSKSIKITTVHGSKGLEAPIVILADTTNTHINKDLFIFDDESNLVLWNVEKKSRNSYLDKEIENLKDDSYKEYLRLFYVALTRARDALIVFGNHKEKEPNKDSWYSIFSEKFEKIANVKDDNKICFVNGDFKYDSFSEIKKEERYIISPCFVGKRINENDTNIKLDEPIYKSPLDQDLSRKYGEIAHKIIEDSVEVKYVIKNHPLFNLLEKSDAGKMLNNIEKLFQAPDFIKIINFDVRTEVDVFLKISEKQIIGKPVIGRIDMLSISDDCIYIIDYKTGRAVPKNITEVPEDYIQQMNFYFKCIKNEYKNKQIKTYIVWLSASEMMEIVFDENN